MAWSRKVLAPPLRGKAATSKNAPNSRRVKYTSLTLSYIKSDMSRRRAVITGRPCFSRVSSSCKAECGGFCKSSNMSVHQMPRPVQLFRFQVGAVGKQIAGPFVVNGIRPFGPEQPRHCQTNKQVSQGGRIQDTGVIQIGRGRQNQYPRFSSCACLVSSRKASRLAASV